MQPFMMDQTEGPPMKPYPEGFPHLDTEEELQQLVLEALNDDDPGIDMNSEEWKRFREGLEVPSREKLAS